MVESQLASFPLVKENVTNIPVEHMGAESFFLKKALCGGAWVV